MFKDSKGSCFNNYVTLIIILAWKRYFACLGNHAQTFNKIPGYRTDPVQTPEDECKNNAWGGNC